MKDLQDVRKHGQFIPHNSKKYVGRYPIIVRSSWERSLYQWLDVNPCVLEWSSESIFIYYYDPTLMKRRRYFPDAYAMIKSKDDKITRFIIEVKPFKEVRPPSVKNNKSRKTMIYEQKTYMTNQAKWNAAQIWCGKMGYKFLVLTEKELFGKK
jgi:hypothetical protein